MWSKGPKDISFEFIAEDQKAVWFQGGEMRRGNLKQDAFLALKSATALGCSVHLPVGI